MYRHLQAILGLIVIIIFFKYDTTKLIRLSLPWVERYEDLRQVASKHDKEFRAALKQAATECINEKSSNGLKGTYDKEIASFYSKLVDISGFLDDGDFRKNEAAKEVEARTTKLVADIQKRGNHSNNPVIQQMGSSNIALSMQLIPLELVPEFRKCALAKARTMLTEQHLLEHS